MSNLNPHLTNRLNSTVRDSRPHDSFSRSSSLRTQNFANQQDQDSEHTILLTQKSTPSFAWLVMIKGKQVGQLFPLERKGTVIGRNKKCQIALRLDKAASSEHAQIYEEDSNFVIHDLASSNKTWVNGQEVYHYILQENDVVTIGETRFVFKQIRDEILNQ